MPECCCINLTNSFSLFVGIYFFDDFYIWYVSIERKEKITERDDFFEKTLKAQDINPLGIQIRWEKEVPKRINYPTDFNFYQ